MGTIIKSIFCAQSGAGIRLNFWEKLGESRYPGALSPVLENFRRALSPDSTDCPWVSEDAIIPAGCVLQGVAENCTTHPLHKAQNLMPPPPSTPPILFWPVNRQPKHTTEKVRCLPHPDDKLIAQMLKANKRSTKAKTKHKTCR